MSSQSLSSLSDGTLRSRLAELTAADRVTTAHLLAHLGEFDARRLYAEDGFSSTFVYCVQRLRFSEDMAHKRIRAARIARRFPFFLNAIADGRVHLTGVVMLKPYLNPGNARELLEVVTHKTKTEIEKLLADRFPQDDVPTFVRALPVKAPSMASALNPADLLMPSALPAETSQVVPEPPRTTVEATPVSASNPFRLPAPTAAVSRFKPIAPGRYALQATIAQETHDKLQRIQDLLGHAVPSGDLAQVLDRAFDALLEKLEKAKCGTTDRPRASAPKPGANPRYMPRSVKREVRARDGNQCTFVSADGQRCTETKFLEYDHVLEVARGGTATAAGIRLLCRTHNQLMAERTFGRDFMESKREAKPGQPGNEIAISSWRVSAAACRSPAPPPP